MLNVLSLPDTRDSFALPHDPRDYRVGLEDGVKGLRIAYSPDLGYADVDPEIAALVRKAADRFEELGAQVEEANPGFENALPMFTTHWFAGAAALLRAFSAEKAKLVDSGLREVARQGAKIPMLDYLDAAMKRGQLTGLMNRFHEKYDLLLTPTLPLAAFEAGKEVANLLKEKRWTDWTPFSYPFNLTQQPAASIPCGLTKKGLPAGLHIVGPRYADALVLRAARAYESTQPIALADVSKL
jgi:aspartyl-tRNA(Asn)/glutamyl-tRNA(Gln) amidotransferase subunit A